MSVRVYVPSTWRGLAELAARGALEGESLQAHAVTEEVRSALPDAGDEEWEYAALTAAAEESLGRLVTEPAGLPRRVVVAADVDAVAPLLEVGPTAVRVTGPVPLRRVAAVHVDSADAEPVVRAAVAAWARFEAGDPDAEAVVERCLDHELGWFARQELDTLLQG